MFLEKHGQALSVTVLADHMTGRVVITVLSIIVGSLVKERLEHLGIATNAGDVQWCPQVLGLAVEMGAKLSENLDHFHVSLVTRHVQRSPTVRVALV